MSANTVVRDGVQSTSRLMLNKVPEVTVFFWVIKVLCTTVGESCADYVNETIGFGLAKTTLLFSVLLVAVGVVQFALRRYVPGVYWAMVVLISVVGTLLTDNLTDGHNVPLWISTAVFSVLLVGVFGVWYARERTLSIHTIVTTRRESFYWLTVLVTFALGTAAGDWTLEVTGWGPGPSVLLPAGLIAAVFVAWRLGAGPVLCFWLAFILTRPLGANIGDFLSSSKDDGGLGLGTLWTSVLFLTAILGTVVYLSITKKDQTEARNSTGLHASDLAHNGARHLLLIADHAGISTDLVRVLNARTAQHPVQLHLVLTNPVEHDIHEQHGAPTNTQAQAQAMVNGLRAQTTAEVVGSVSVRHDPMDAVEETLQNEAIDEILVSVKHHRIAHTLHQDIADRLANKPIPVTSLDADIGA